MLQLFSSNISNSVQALSGFQTFTPIFSRSCCSTKQEHEKKKQVCGISSVVSFQAKSSMSSQNVPVSQGTFLKDKQNFIHFRFFRSLEKKSIQVSFFPNHLLSKWPNATPRLTINSRFLGLVGFYNAIWSWPIGRLVDEDGEKFLKGL